MSFQDNCWDHFNCSHKECLVKIFSAANCWAVPTLRCRDEIVNDFSDKIKKCLNCSYYITKNTSDNHEAQLLQMIQCSFTEVANLKKAREEEKKSENPLKISEEKYRALIDKIQEGVFIVQGGKFYFVNDAFANMTGYTADELTGMEFYGLIATEHRKQLADRYYSRNPEDSVLREYKFDILHKDGSTLVAVCMNSGAFPFLGKIASIGTIKDVTDKKRAEQERQKLETRLQQSQKMEAIGTLAGGIAHEFNNLLMGILGNATLAMMNMDPSNPDYVRLQNIENNVQKGADLTQRLLGFAREGKFEVKTTDMNQMIRMTTESLGRTRKGITLSLSLQDDICKVDIDQGQIEQVLKDIYTNAWQAMPGGGTLYLKTENVILDESYIQPFSVTPGNYVKISITDTGVGMDQETQKRIFDPFFTTREKGRGTGLGLPSAYGIIKNHDGFINVYSEKGHGTTFAFYLPATDKTSAGAMTTPETIVKGTGKVLLVDDEPVILDVGSQLLERLGYDVITARNGKEAIDLFQHCKEETALVILDMIMPVMGGSETFDRLKSEYPEVKVLLSSGYSVDGQASDILRRGCNGFIQKPFNLEQLARKISDILSA